MLIVKPILIEKRKKKKTIAEAAVSLVFYDLHSQRYRRLILILLFITP